MATTKYLAQRAAADANIAKKGFKCYLVVKTTQGEVDENGDVVDVTTDVEFPAIRLGFDAKDWADSNQVNFYSIGVSDIKLLAGAGAFATAGVVPKAGMLVKMPEAGTGTLGTYIIVRVRALAPDGEPVMYPMLHIRSHDGG